MIVKELEGLETRYDLILADPPWRQSRGQKVCA